MIIYYHTSLIIFCPYSYSIFFIIEVGYGGGGSGGAANNDAGGTVTSANANTTLGTEGVFTTRSGRWSDASRGGMGAMHSLISPWPGYASDLQKGSSAAEYNAETALGGGVKATSNTEGRGKGGAGGGVENISGGIFASGGGGGAAGGFTLNSSNVFLQEL